MTKRTWNETLRYMALFLIMIKAYDLDDFINACKSCNVYVRNDAKRGAQVHLTLHTKEEVVAFIAGDGLENLEHKRNKEWEKCPANERPIRVDSYVFQSGAGLKGYIAFFYRPQKSRWEIKSLKKDKYSNLSNPALMDGLKMWEKITIPKESE